MPRTQLIAYRCPICSNRTAQPDSVAPLAVLWCLCLPATPTRMERESDDHLIRGAMRAVFNRKSLLP